MTHHPRLPKPHRQGEIEVRDGRKLGFAEYGARDGRPIIWFHGTPGARGQIVPRTRDEADERNLRLVVVERPGYGASTSYRYQSLAEWPPDLKQFVDTLGIDRFGVVGMSGGGPYALACARALPERVTVVATLGGVAPSVGDEAAPGGGATKLARLFAPMLRYTWRPLGWSAARVISLAAPVADPGMLLFLQLMPTDDQIVFAEHEARHSFTQDLIDASRAGRMQGLYLDAMLYARPWGFSLREIKRPVHLWQGDEDPIVLLRHAQHMANLIPRSQLELHRHEGHLGSLAATPEIFDAILEDWDQS